MKTVIYLLRHGATNHNLEVPYRLQGSNVDEPLAPVGIAQSEAARDMLRPVPLSAVYSSPLSRARLTAEIIAAPHALQVATIADLREGSVGRWENRTWEEIQVTEPDAYHRFINDPGTHGYAGGDNFNQVLQRVKPVVLELLQRHAGQSIAIVGHQIVNRVLVADLMGLSMTAARKIKFSNAGVSIITAEAGKPMLTSLNITWPAMLNPS